MFIVSLLWEIWPHFISMCLRFQSGQVYSCLPDIQIKPYSPKDLTVRAPPPLEWKDDMNMIDLAEVLKVSYSYMTQSRLMLWSVRQLDQYSQWRTSFHILWRGAKTEKLPTPICCRFLESSFSWCYPEYLFVWLNVEEWTFQPKHPHNGPFEAL